MAIKLHRCSGTAIRGPHPCWKVQKALDEAGIDYETVKHPSFPRGRRTEYNSLTGQQKLPAIEFEDGHVLCEDSDALVERIRSGRLRDWRPISVPARPAELRSPPAPPAARAR